MIGIGITYSNTSISRGVLGPELATNGSFSTDSNWTKGNGWTISGGTANHVDPNGGLSQLIPIVAGAQYRIKWTVLNYVSGFIYSGFIGGTAATAPSKTANGSYTDIVTANSGNNTLYFGVGSFTGSIDNISVRRIL